MARVNRLDRASYVQAMNGDVFKVLGEHKTYLWLQADVTPASEPFTAQAEAYTKYVPVPRKDQIWVNVNEPDDLVKILATPNDDEVNNRLVTYKTVDNKSYATILADQFVAFFRPSV